MSENLRGSLLMVLAMAGFALEDMFVKLLADALPVGQILMVLGAGGGLIFGLIALAKGQQFLSVELLSPPVLLRNLAEVLGTVGFVLAIVLTTISSASAILQAAPLAVTMGAALFFGEPVGWRRWCAICAGFTGVLLIIRPGMEGFQMASLWAVLGVVGLAARDLATRAVPRRVSSYQLSAWAFALMVPTGALMLLVMDDSPVMPDGLSVVRLAGALGIGVLAYYALVAAVRLGDVSVVTPFRYTRLVFAMIVGIIVFGERPDVLTLTGAAIIVAAGIFTIWRESRARAFASAKPGL